MPFRIPAQLTLLIASQNPQLRRQLAAALAPAYCLLEAENGRAALRATLEHKIDLLITDIALTDMYGEELARLMQLDRPKLKVLYLTPCEGSRGKPLAVMGQVVVLEGEHPAACLESAIRQAFIEK
jgi:DNA-binding NarL/FixJ family response regulator